MKKYLKYLGFGFLTLILYIPIHISMAVLQMGLYHSSHDEIYGTFETSRNPSVLINIFILMCVLFIIMLFAFSSSEGCLTLVMKKCFMLLFCL